MSLVAESMRRVARQVAASATALIAVVVLVAAAVPLPGAVAQGTDGDGNVDAGREVFANNCAACHGASAEGRGDAPALVGVYDRHTREEIEAVIRQGRGRMPAFDGTLSDAQIDDVMAFLADASDDEGEPRRGPQMHRWWDDMMWNGTGGVGVVVWMIFGLLLLALLVVGVVWLVRQVSSDSGRPNDQQRAPSSASGSAREDLDRRYARGEISREEYRTIRGDLEG